MHRLMHIARTIGASLALVVLGLLIHPVGLSAKSGRIVVLSGQDLKPYHDVLAGLQQSLSKQGLTTTVEVYPLQGNPTKTQDVLSDLKKTGARLVVTLGSAATQAAVRAALAAAGITTVDSSGATSNAALAAKAASTDTATTGITDVQIAQIRAILQAVDAAAVKDDTTESAKTAETTVKEDTTTKTTQSPTE